MQDFLCSYFSIIFLRILYCHSGYETNVEETVQWGLSICKFQGILPLLYSLCLRINRTWATNRWEGCFGWGIIASKFSTRLLQKMVLVPPWFLVLFLPSYVLIAVAYREHSIVSGKDVDQCKPMFDSQSCPLLSCMFCGVFLIFSEPNLLNRSLSGLWGGLVITLLMANCAPASPMYWFWCISFNLPHIPVR